MKKINLFSLLLLLILSSCATSIRTTFIADSGRMPANFQTCFQMMNAVVNHRPVSQGLGDFTSANTLAQLEEAYGNDSLIDIQRGLNEPTIKATNELTQKLLKKPLVLKGDSGKTTYVTKEEAQTLLDSIENSKVNRDHFCYDPDNTTGFCFGRAIIGHMEALARGVHPDAIKKIWIAGDMKEWGHHVAPIVKAKEGWLVLDTNIGRPVTTEEWQEYYRPFKAAKAKEVMMFVTQGGRFGPYDAEAYSAINLFNTTGNTFNREADFYKGYFHDYFDTLDKNKSIKKFPVR